MQNDKIALQVEAYECGFLDGLRADEDGRMVLLYEAKDRIAQLERRYDNVCAALWFAAVVASGFVVLFFAREIWG